MRSASSTSAELVPVVVDVTAAAAEEPRLPKHQPRNSDVGRIVKSRTLLDRKPDRTAGFPSSLAL
jgi:hypothetical protein